MVELASKYSDAEYGWVSEKFQIDEPAYIIVKLSGRGRVAVKKSNTTDGDYVNVLTTPISGPTFEFQISGEVEDKCLELITSVKPESIEIWGDMEPVEDRYLKVDKDSVSLTELGRIQYIHVYSNTLWKVTV